MSFWYGVAATLAFCVSGCVGSAHQAPVLVAPERASIGYTKRIQSDGSGGFILPDGTRVPADGAGGFTLPNGTHLGPDRAGNLALPTGAVCVPDGLGGYQCP